MRRTALLADKSTGRSFFGWLVAWGFALAEPIVVPLLLGGFFLLISTLLIVNADENTLSVFSPGTDGVKPAFQGMIFCLLAFIGFEAAAPPSSGSGWCWGSSPTSSCALATQRRSIV